MKIGEKIQKSHSSMLIIDKETGACVLAVATEEKCDGLKKKIPTPEKPSNSPARQNDPQAIKLKIPDAKNKKTERIPAAKK